MDFIEFTDKFIKSYNSAIKNKDNDLILLSCDIFKKDDLNRLNLAIINYNSCSDKMYKLTYEMQIQDIIKNKIGEMKTFIDLAEDMDEFGNNQLSFSGW